MPVHMDKLMIETVVMVFIIKVVSQWMSVVMTCFWAVNSVGDVLCLLIM